MALIVLSFAFLQSLLPLAIFIALFFILQPFHKRKEPSYKSIILPLIILAVQVMIVYLYVDVWFFFELLLLPLYAFFYIALNKSAINIYLSNKNYALKVIMSVVVVLFLVLHMFPYGISYRVKLSFFLPKCKTVINEVEQGKYLLGQSYEKNGLKFSINEKLPLKVVFVFKAGVVDNWVGLVYDPSRFVEKTKEFKLNSPSWNDKRFEDVKGLFGGDMYDCNLIEESWYICSFT